MLSSLDWKFKPETETVQVTYAREKVVQAGTGIAAGFPAPDYSDFTWQLVHLSTERTTLRDWWVLGPFPDPNHGEGYNRIYPPEQKIDVNGKYADPYGADIGWRQYHSTEGIVNVTEALALDPKGGSRARFRNARRPAAIRSDGTDCRFHQERNPFCCQRISGSRRRT